MLKNFHFGNRLFKCNFGKSGFLESHLQIYSIQFNSILFRVITWRVLKIEVCARSHFVSSVIYVVHDSVYNSLPAKWKLFPQSDIFIQVFCMDVGYGQGREIFFIFPWWRLIFWCFYLKKFNHFIPSKENLLV